MDEKLYQLFEDAKRNFKESGSDYDAGIVEGLKRALEIVEKLLEEEKR